MFEQALKDKLKKVFELQRVSYNSPISHDDAGNVMREQETLFLQITESKNAIKDGRVRMKVTGNGILFAPNDALPFGYFSKCIAKHSDDTKDLFFYQIEENVVLHHNLVQRGFSFVYFFDSQYDPNLGTLNSLDTDIEVET